MKYFKIVLIAFLISIGLDHLSGQTTSPLFLVEATGGCGNVSNCSINQICIDVMIIPDTTGIINSYNIWIQYTGGNLNYVSDQACRTQNGSDNNFNSQGYYRISGVQGSTMATEDVAVKLHNICFTFTSLEDIQDREILVGGTVFGSINSTLTYNQPILNEVIPAYSFKMDQNNISCILLPVTWLDFRVSKQKETGLLEWATSEEFNNKGFEVQRSISGQNYTTIGWVDSNIPPGVINRYQFVDADPVAGVNYYRLKQFDLDGRYDFSPVRWVTFPDQDFVVRIMPNPAKEFLEVEVTTRSMDSEIVLLDAVGRIVLRKELRSTDPMARLELHNLNPGSYTVVVNSGINKVIESIIIIK